MSNNNNDDNVSTILMVIGLFTVFYLIVKFFQTDFGGNLLLLIIFVPIFIFSFRNLLFEKELSLLDRWPYLLMSALFGTIIYILFF